ncbi:Hypothetical predicted protein [Podarcis lilfordi]|uniref:Uncharacterized protein n=1 Tax=Podarcis lilfordi TaxID=74358 RepID=A0AA35KIV6_9SAUR|nr:Hypothetical predicted protein [Podarcis lilfordi]
MVTVARQQSNVAQLDFSQHGACARPGPDSGDVSPPLQAQIPPSPPALLAATPDYSVANRRCLLRPPAPRSPLRPPPALLPTSQHCEPAESTPSRALRRFGSPPPPRAVPPPPPPPSHRTEPPSGPRQLGSRTRLLLLLLPPRSGPAAGEAATARRAKSGLQLSGQNIL